jgi:uncharacterized protein involved in cysteine biosynthesis
MLDALGKSLSQLLDPYLWRVIVLSFIVSLLILSGLTGLAWYGLGSFTLFGGVQEILVDILGGGIAVFMAYLLFPAVAGIITSLFLERVVSLTEETHYPDKPAPREQSYGEIIWETVKLTLIIVFCNLVAMPLYLLLWFFGFGIILYYLLNGYLLGREFFEMVAIRRLEPEAVKAMRHTHRRKVFLSGIIIAFGFTIPIVNFFMPIIAATFMVHVFEGLQSGEIK